MPLTKEQLKEMGANIAKAEKALKEAKADAGMAKRALIDTSDTDEQIKTLEKQIRALKAVYGTGV